MYYREMSGSMVPFLRQGDLVKVMPYTCCQLGDIILWQRGESMVMHRVVCKFSNRIMTKGDAVAHFDTPVPIQNILGKATSRERDGKTSSLDSLGSRVMGLAFSLTISWSRGLLSILVAIKRFGRETLGLAS
jgi:hypothetical protein